MAKSPVIEIYSSDEDHHEEERKTEREVIVLDDEEEKEERAKPIGDVVRIIGTGTMKRKHYASFKLKDYVYKLEMTVLLDSDDEMERAYVAVIRICWEEEVIAIVSELERVTYEAMGNDFQKYNQKMRQLHFNLKNSTMLAKRLLKKELEPIALLVMTPEELKEGLTAEERTAKEPEKPEQMRMIETRCSRCMEKQVGVTAVIQTGDKEDHYQSEVRIGSSRL